MTQDPWLKGTEAAESHCHGHRDAAPQSPRSSLPLTDQILVFKTTSRDQNSLLLPEETASFTGQAHLTTTARPGQSCPR